MSRSPLVLCADDDADILSLVRLRLERAGYRVVTAEDGQKAIELLRAQSPELAVLDVMMPKRTGHEVLAEVRADPALRDLKVILLSARVQESDVAEGMGSGADAYLPKPFRAGDLLDTVRGLLEPS
jgi:DNA-binding response OmpR family regulator